MAFIETVRFATDNGTLFVTLTVGDGAQMAEGPINVQLAHHDDVEVAWWASFSCTPTDEVWKGQVALEPAPSRRLYQLTRAQDNAGALFELTQPFLFLEPATAGDWATGEPAEVERQRLEQARAARYDMVLADPNAVAADPTFAVVMLADNLLLTTNQRVPGIRAMPLVNTTLGADIAEVLNALLAQTGFAGHVEPERWLDLMRNRRPSVMIHLPQVRASQPQAAVEFCRRIVHPLLDLFALRRGATPRLLGGAIGQLDSQGHSQYAGFWIEGGGYGGNLIGGFASGEDQRGLIMHWDGMARDARVKLWLSLYADAIADDRWDYILFRCFNLLEGIGADLLPRKADILDDQGNPRLKGDGKPFTTKDARGKVYELCRLVASRQNHSVDPKLWDDVGIWVDIRNQVAHRGGWSLPEGEAPTTKHQRVEAGLKSRGHDGSLGSGIDAIIREIREAVKSTLYAGLLGRL